MKKFDELEQQEAALQKVKSKTLEKVSISPKTIAIISGILIIVIIGAVLLFIGPEKRYSAETNINEKNNRNTEVVEEYGEDIWHYAREGKYKFRVYGYDPQSAIIYVQAQDTTTEEMYAGQIAVFDADSLAKAKADGISYSTSYKVRGIETINGGFRFVVYFDMVKNDITYPDYISADFTLDNLVSEESQNAEEYA